ncbi:hypothetical protein GJV78_16550 [Escherichia alba]|uniref:Uncharacterized protein n=1 Tax=Intestinirhabdus alba TaxID=2899544 RepID=A0A6L6IR11_9ENTR|nr:hypothetical protein [Intestinirhabdus alba]
MMYTMCQRGRIVTRRNEVLAETGGAVSALTPPRAHCVTSTSTTLLCGVAACATAGNRQRRGTSADRAPLPQETRV